jgi:hypothetical protein
MTEDTFQFFSPLKPFEHVYFQENVSEGDKDVYFEILSETNPKLLALINESPVYNESRFTTFYPENSTAHQFYQILPQLELQGQEKRRFTAEQHEVYLTFISLELEAFGFELRLQSKRSACNQLRGEGKCLQYSFLCVVLVVDWDNGDAVCDDFDCGLRGE